MPTMPQVLRDLTHPDDTLTVPPAGENISCVGHYLRD